MKNNYAEEEGYMPFDMEEDYEGAQIDNEGYLSFKKEKKKKTARFSKEEQIYGIFMDEEFQKDEKQVEDSLDFAFKAMNGLQAGFRKSGKVQHDPRKQVTVKFAKNKVLEFDEENQERQREENEENEEDYEENNLFKAGLGLKKQKFQQNQKIIDNLKDYGEGEEKIVDDKKLKRKHSFDNSSGEEDQEIIISKEQKRLKRQLDFKRQIKDRSEEQEFKSQAFYLDLPTQFGMSKKAQQKEAQKEKQKQQKEEQKNSKFETENKAVFGKGFDLLKKLGYKEGKGMGKSEQGIQKPIEATFKNQFTVKDTQKNSNKYANQDGSLKTGMKKLRKYVDQEVEDLQQQINQHYQEEKELEEQKEAEFYSLQVQKKWEKGDKNKKQKSLHQKVKNKDKDDAFQFLLNKPKKQYNDYKNLQNIEEKTAGLKTMKITDMTREQIEQFSDLKEIKPQQQYQQQQFQQGNITYINQTLKNTQNLLAKISKRGQHGKIKSFLLLAKEKYDTLNGQLENLQKKIKYEEDLMVNNDYQVKQLQEKNEGDQKRVEETENLLEFLKKINKKKEVVEEGDVVKLNKLFGQMFRKNRKQFCSFNLEKIFVNQFALCFKNNMESNSINLEGEKIGHGNFDFNYLKQLKPEIQKIHDILKDVYLFQENMKLKNYDAYLEKDDDYHILENTQLQDPKPLKHCMDYLIQKGLLPQLRTFINRTFVPSENYELIDFFLEWQDLISLDLLQDLFQNLILQQLLAHIKQQTQNIDQLQNNNLPHLWIVPWFEILKKETIDEICRQVLQSLSLLLQQFDAKKNAQKYLNLIKPWKRQLQIIQNESIFEQFTNKSLLPKLMFALNLIEIDPAEQNQEDLKTLKKICQFSEILTDKQILMLFEETIMTKISDIITEWTNQDQYESQEIKLWLDQWKSLLGIGIMRIQVVQTYFMTFYRQAGVPYN